MKRSLQDFLDIRYFMRFAVILGFFYCLNGFIIGITTPGGLYYPFVANHLNYPVWLRTSTLYGAKMVTDLLHYPSKIVDDSLMNLQETKIIQMGWPCYGLMIMSFWLAFVMAHSGSLKKRIQWTLLGILTIWIINIARVAILYVAQMDGWSVGQALSTNNHDLFNYTAYLAIIILMFVYKSKRKPVESRPIPTTPVLA